MMVVGLEEAGPTYFPPFSTYIPHNVGEEVLFCQSDMIDIIYGGLVRFALSSYS